VTPDGLALVIATTRGGADDDLWIATREDPDDPFLEPEPLAVVNQPEAEWSPWLSPDRLRLYFASSRPGSVDFDIYLARRDHPDDDFRSPAPLTELNSDGAERWIRLSQDEREAFVASTRSGGAGQLDLYRFTRADRDAIFGDAEPLSALNTGGDDVGPFLASDGLSLYFNADAQMSGGALADISVATRPCE
jgi:Tol biopolymer transport system component